MQRALRMALCWCVFVLTLSMTSCVNLSVLTHQSVLKVMLKVRQLNEKEIQMIYLTILAGLSYKLHQSAESG